MPAIIEYESKYAAGFKRLNLDWMDKYVLTEAPELAMLDNLLKEILDNVICIYLAAASGEIVGSATLTANGNGNYALAKITVQVVFQGKGISK